jgi:hypothetical protein
MQPLAVRAKTGPPADFYQNNVDPQNTKKPEEVLGLDFVLQPPRVLAVRIAARARR